MAKLKKHTKEFQVMYTYLSVSTVEGGRLSTFKYFGTYYAAEATKFATCYHLVLRGEFTLYEYEYVLNTLYSYTKCFRSQSLVG